jgi:hypothetical protein
MMEAMKMQNTVYAPCDGVVAELHVALGDRSRVKICASKSALPVDSSDDRASKALREGRDAGRLTEDFMRSPRGEFERLKRLAVRASRQGKLLPDALNQTARYAIAELRRFGISDGALCLWSDDAAYSPHRAELEAMKLRDRYWKLEDRLIRLASDAGINIDDIASSASEPLWNAIRTEVWKATRRFCEISEHPHQNEYNELKELAVLAGQKEELRKELLGRLTIWVISELRRFGISDGALCLWGHISGHESHRDELDSIEIQPRYQELHDVMMHVARFAGFIHGKSGFRDTMSWSSTPSEPLLKALCSAAWTATQDYRAGAPASDLEKKVFKQPLFYEPPVDPNTGERIIRRPWV